MSCSAQPGRNPTLSPPWKCGKPNASCSLASSARGARKNETAEGRGNDGRVENEENQTQVSPRFPQPLEIAARFPHSHRLGAAWKSGKPKAGLPLSHSLFS